jgi:uncharacterized protein
VSSGTVLELWRYPVKSMSGERLARSDVTAQGLCGDRGWAVRDDVSGEIHNAKRFPCLMQCAAAYREPPRPGEIPPVDITFPDGRTLGSDSPTIAAHLSDLMGHPVALHALRPAADLDFYRRRERGASVIGALAKYRTARRWLGWAANRGLAGGDLRKEFGREATESLPDFSNLPPEIFEYYTPPGTYFDLFPIHILTTAALRAMSRLNPSADWDVRRFRPNVLIDVGVNGPDHVEAEWVNRRIQVGGVMIKGELPTMRCAMPMHAQTDLPRDPSVLRTIVREADHCLGLYASVEQSGSILLGDPVSAAT